VGLTTEPELYNWRWLSGQYFSYIDPKWNVGQPEGDDLQFYGSLKKAKKLNDMYTTNTKYFVCEFGEYQSKKFFK
jgi:hypothetical protein